MGPVVRENPFSAPSSTKMAPTVLKSPVSAHVVRKVGSNPTSLVQQIGLLGHWDTVLLRKDGAIISNLEHNPYSQWPRSARRPVLECGMGGGGGHCQKREGAKPGGGSGPASAGLRSLSDDVTRGRQGTGKRRSSTQSDRVSPFFGDCPPLPPIPPQKPMPRNRLWHKRFPEYKIRSMTTQSHGPKSSDFFGV